MKAHPWNRAFGALLPLKKELYRAEDIKEIEQAANDLIKQFEKEGITLFADQFKQTVVRELEIKFKPVSDLISYVDLDTLKINLIS